MEEIFIYGASGHGKVVIDVIERQGLYSIAFLVDDDPALKGKEFFGYPVVGGMNDLLESRSSVVGGIVSIGSNAARMKVAKKLAETGFRLISAVHPAAQLGRGVTVGDGTVIMAGVVVNADARIGSNAVLNTRASIDHDCVIGDGAHIAPGATLCGTVRVGAESFVCAGATIIPNLAIGARSIIGAGSTVIGDVPDAATVVGSPAKIIRQF